MIVMCKKCRTCFHLDPSRIPEGGTRVRCSRCRQIFPVRPPRAGILAAKEDREFLIYVKELLSGQPFEVLTALDGREAMEKIQRFHPAVALLDVALPKVYGFELCEVLKSDSRTRDIRIILLASIHSHTRYKRLPASLYGADAYLEIHHLADKLLPKIRALLPDLFAPSGPEKNGAVPAQRPVGSQPLRGPENIENRAQRLARTILSDIALYNQKKIENGIRGRNLEKMLASELEEAGIMMKQRFPQVPENTLRDFLKREIDLLVLKNPPVSEG